MTSYFAPEKTSPDGWSDPGPASRRRGVPALCLDRLRIECQRALEHFDRRAGASRVRVAPSAVPRVALPPPPDRADRAGNLFRTTIGGGASNDGTMFGITNCGFGSGPVFAGTPSKAKSYGQSVLALQQMDRNLDATAQAVGLDRSSNQHRLSGLKAAASTPDHQDYIAPSAWVA